MTPDPHAVTRALVRWFTRAHRDLPWRRTRDPYAIWISETMLQQTQVSAVIPYYQRFLKSFPTAAALDRAPLKKVLTSWSGLGYYRRAENLKKAAADLVRRHGGRLPGDHEALRALPGVGAYTAGALMSIAFGKPFPAVDGNVRRVLGRLFEVSSESDLRELATQLVPQHRPGEFNQALMELGATLCTPLAPTCDSCPLSFRCASRRGALTPKSLPAKTQPRFTSVTWPLAIVCRNGKVLLRRRAANGLLRGMWELPGGELKKPQSVTAALRRELGAVDSHHAKPLPIGALRHTITYRKIHAPIFLLRLRPAAKLTLPSASWRWLAPASVRRYPVSSMTAKALAIFAAHEKSSV
jgi:A/G-specific adenine glycosylase